MQTPSLQKLFSILPEARMVGGCVRDGLLGHPIKDVDLAVPLLPDEVMRRLANADIKALPTGLDHGTVTAIIEHSPYEITSLRRDIEHDGRWARVHFTEHWHEDAMRRDLTINALYLSADGVVFDYATGVEDLRDGRVRFVGSAKERMREDYLRILRFFRFHSRYALGSFDEEAAKAAQELAEHLKSLSAERIQSETLQLLLTPRLIETWQEMIDLNIVFYFLPHAVRIERLKKLLSLEKEEHIAPDPIRRLAALLTEDQGRQTGIELKLSNEQRRRLTDLTSSEREIRSSEASEIKRLIYKWGKDVVIDRILIDQPQGYANIIRLAQDWPCPEYPLTGKDLLKNGVTAGPKMGVVLNKTEDWWIKGDFSANKEQCLNYAFSLISEIK